MFQQMHNPLGNNYSKNVQPTPIRKRRKMKHNLNTVCLPNVKSSFEKIQKICSLYGIRKVFKSSTILHIYILRVKPPVEKYLNKDCVAQSYAVVIGYKSVKHASPPK